MKTQNQNVRRKKAKYNIYLMSKSLGVFLVILVLLNCKNDTNTQFSKNKIQEDYNSVQQPIQFSGCEQLIEQLLKSSNLEALRNYKNIEFRIDSKDAIKILIKGFVLNDVSEIEGEKRIQENTVAWIEFYPNSNRLVDITYDPENPKNLTFDNSILDTFNLSELCEIELSTVQTNSDCKEIMGDMMSGEECFFKNQSVEQVYQKIIDDKLVENSDFLLKTVPLDNQIVELNQNGLVRLSYEISENQISIDFNYEGGVTSIELIQKEDGTIRRIIHSAD